MLPDWYIVKLRTSHFGMFGAAYITINEFVKIQNILAFIYDLTVVLIIIFSVFDDFFEEGMVDLGEE